MSRQASAASHRKGGLQINERPAFQERTWRLERIGWAIAVILLVAAILGLFSEGVFSRTAAEPGDGSLIVHYDRFARLETPTRLIVELAADPAVPGSVGLSFDSAYLEDVEIGVMSPPPLQAALAPDRAIHRFAVEGSGKVQVTIDVSPQRIGLLDASIRREPNGKPVQISQFVYP